jgi:hypothetical protein
VGCAVLGVSAASAAVISTAVVTCSGTCSILSGHNLVIVTQLLFGLIIQAVVVTCRRSAPDE